MNENKTATVNIKMTVAMRDQLLEKAREKALSLSTYCRMVLAGILKGD